MGRKAKKSHYKNYRKISQRRMTAEGTEEHDVEKAEIDRLRSIVAEAGNHRGECVTTKFNASLSTPLEASTAELSHKMERFTPKSSGAVGFQSGERSDEEKGEMDRIRTLLRESTDHLRATRKSSLAPALPSKASYPTACLDASEENRADLVHVTAFVSAGCSATAALSHDPKVVSEERPSQDALSSPPPMVGPETDDSSVNGCLLDQAVFGKSDAHRFSVSYPDEENPLVVLGRKKQKRKDSSVEAIKRVELTPQERKQAVKAAKNASRKLAQLERRASQKAKRTELYRQLQETSLPTSQLQLLGASSTLGGQRTQKQMLRWLVQKERAGLNLTDDERSLLYRDRRNESRDGGDAPAQEILFGTTTSISKLSVTEEDAPRKSSTSSEGHTEAGRSPSPGFSSFPPSHEVRLNAADTGGSNDVPTTAGAADTTSYASQLMSSLMSLKSATASAMAMKTTATALASKSTNPVDPAISGPDPNLKNDSNASNDDGVFIPPPAKKKRYIPPEPATLKTAAALGLSPHGASAPGQKVMEIQRPPDIQATRYDLPVSTMEFEVMDAIRNHDVIILCSETGSGKSTQVPQFLYEYGFASDGLMVGVTQPRRVAAVSTAKRVAYEMGSGDGAVITSRPVKFGADEDDRLGTGNVVAYQTRYEAAGLGSRTRIKFMTDGLLLQEVQSDLLLRRYSVIVLDEAHERNLNTDVLIGLMSKALVLRKHARQEGSLPGLKLVIMSATLRVEDFTANRLFETPPVVVRVPGRAHPVTIHHSKATEMDNYGTWRLMCPLGYIKTLCYCLLQSQ
jgi:hypothetical protein